MISVEYTCNLAVNSVQVQRFDLTKPPKLLHGVWLFPFIKVVLWCCCLCVVWPKFLCTFRMRGKKKSYWRNLKKALKAPFQNVISLEKKKKKLQKNCLWQGKFYSVVSFCTTDSISFPEQKVYERFTHWSMSMQTSQTTAAAQHKRVIL